MSRTIRFILAPARFVRDVVISFCAMGDDGNFGTGHVTTQRTGAARERRGDDK